MLCVEALDLAQLDVGVLGVDHDSTSDPPLSAGQARGQVCARPKIMSLVRLATVGDDFAVSWLPKSGGLRLVAEYNCVIPTPNHCSGAPRHVRDGYEVAGRDPLHTRRRELRRVSDGDNLPRGQDVANRFLHTQHDTAAKLRANQGVSGRSRHPARLP
ncbi:MAG: hypothetical protein ACREOA_00475 [Candidatus Dormibacteria bacterium]